MSSGKFLGKVFTHFSRPRQKFLADTLYGIQASGDTQLSSVMRAINDDSGMCHAVEKRLSRNMADATIGDDIDKAILAAGAKFVRDDTLILVDPTEIRKERGDLLLAVAKRRHVCGRQLPRPERRERRQQPPVLLARAVQLRIEHVARII